jgi:hypothetical protein
MPARISAGAIIRRPQAAAVTELRDLAGGRADLLAEVCGIFEGASAGRAR